MIYQDWRAKEAAKNTVCVWRWTAAYPDKPEKTVRVVVNHKRDGVLKPIRYQEGHETVIIDEILAIDMADTRKIGKRGKVYQCSLRGATASEVELRLDSTLPVDWFWPYRNHPQRVRAEVLYDNQEDGKLYPIHFWVEDRDYRIDEFLGAGFESDPEVGGQGVCYRCRVESSIIKLYLDDLYWIIPRSQVEGLRQS